MARAAIDAGIDIFIGNPKEKASFSLDLPWKQSIPASISALVIDPAVRLTNIIELRSTSASGWYLFARRTSGSARARGCGIRLRIKSAFGRLKGLRPFILRSIPSPLDAHRSIGLEADGLRPPLRVELFAPLAHSFIRTSFFGPSFTRSIRSCGSRSNKFDHTHRTLVSVARDEWTKWTSLVPRLAHSFTRPSLFERGVPPLPRSPTTILYSILILRISYSLAGESSRGAARPSRGASRQLLRNLEA